MSYKNINFLLNNIEMNNVHYKVIFIWPTLTACVKL